MNIHPMNGYLELPCLESEHATTIYQAIWRALRDAGVSFTCHWGQEYGMDAASVRTYFGDRVERWQQARRRLLDTPEARAVFTNPLLSRLALDGAAQSGAT
jgi:hypothetical protein